MIPGAFPGARILSYTYPKMSATTADEYLDKAAQKLLESLIQARAKLPYNRVPMIFVGYGFGGLVLQKLLVLAVDAPDERNKDSAQLLSMIAGLVLLDTPFPATQQENQTGTLSFPSSSNARQEHIMRRLKESGSKVDIGALWEKFDQKRVIDGQKLPMIWLHTFLAKDPSSASKVNIGASIQKKTKLTKYRYNQSGHCDVSLSILYSVWLWPQIQTGEGYPGSPVRRTQSTSDLWNNCAAACCSKHLKEKSWKTF
jgi:hypothetical protein